MTDDTEQHSTDLINDNDVQITDLDPSYFPQHRHAEHMLNLARKGLNTPWIRTGLPTTLLLLLLCTLLIQVPPSAPGLVKSRPGVVASTFLNATTTSGFIFIQSTDHTLSAYQDTTGYVIWRIKLPAQSTIIAENHTLYCSFQITPDHTELEALDANNGKVLWYDAFPAVLSLAGIGQSENFIGNNLLGTPFLYQDNVLYILGSDGTSYAIQASTGYINWSYHVHDTLTQSTSTPQAGSTQPSGTILYVQDGVFAFMSANAILHILNANTGQNIFSFPPASPASQLSLIDGHIFYILPASSPSVVPIRAFHMPDGKLLWTYHLPKDTSIQAEIGDIVYLNAAADSTLIALRGSDGHQLWTYHSGDDRPVTPTFFVENGIGYLIQHDTTVVGVRVSNGQVLWHTRIDMLQKQNPQHLTFELDQGNLLLFDLALQPSSGIPVSVYILNASDGRLLWSSSNTPPDSIPDHGTLYTMQDDGHLDAWQESDGQHLWRYNAPFGSSILKSPTEGSPLLFLLDPTSTFYVLRPSNGKLLWHYP